MNTSNSTSTAITSTPLFPIPLLASNSCHPPAPTILPPAAAKARSSPPYVLPKKHRTTIRCPNKRLGNDCRAYVSTHSSVMQCSCPILLLVVPRRVFPPPCFLCSDVPSPPPAPKLLLLVPLNILPPSTSRAKSSPLCTLKEASNDNPLSKQTAG